jgi:hypothetical protein
MLSSEAPPPKSSHTRFSFATVTSKIVFIVMETPAYLLVIITHTDSNPFIPDRNAGLQ